MLSIIDVAGAATLPVLVLLQPSYCKYVIQKMYGDVVLQGLPQAMSFMSGLLYHFAGRKGRRAEISWHVDEYVDHIHYDFVGSCGGQMGDVLSGTAYILVLFERLRALTFSFEGWRDSEVRVVARDVLRCLQAGVTRVMFHVSKFCVDLEC